MLDRRFFFTHVRAALFDGRLRAGQSQGLTVLLDAWEHDHQGRDLRHLAYMLATAHHETARTMQPIREYGGPAYLTRMYDVRGARPALARRMGNTAPGDGIRYCGRGYVQLTWKVNYLRAGEALGIDLVGSPDRAMEPAIAATIMFSGMREGWFTGQKLADFLGPDREDWRNARRIINGTDKAELIRSHALAYRAALRDVPDQPSRAMASAKAASSAKAQSPKARKSAPVSRSASTAAASGA